MSSSTVPSSTFSSSVFTSPPGSSVSNSSSQNSLNEIQRFREIVHGNNPKLATLKNLESSMLFRNGSSRPTSLAERVNILEAFENERYSLLFEKALSYKNPGQTVQSLTRAKEELTAFRDVINKFSNNSQEFKQAFYKLPQHFRNQLAWAIWFIDGGPAIDLYGENRLKSDLSIITIKKPNLMFLKGNNLVEQLLFQAEQQLAIEQAKETLDHLKNISKLVSSQIDQKLINEIDLLPEEWQTRLKNEFFVDSKGPSVVINKFISEQETKLKKLEMAARLEEFERLTVLYGTASSKQWEELLNKASPKVAAFNKQEFEFSRASPKVLEWIKNIQISSSTIENFSDDTNLYDFRGAHFDGANTFFQVFAPNAKNVSVVLTAFGNEEHIIAMKKNNEEVWEVATPNASPGRTYRYLIEDCKGKKFYRTDPFGVAILENNDVFESVVGSNEKYPWSDSHKAWIQHRPPAYPLQIPRIIYELHVEFWRKKDGRLLGYRELASQLISHCKKMNITHVELYGLLENPGGWGYTVRNYFTPNHRMGTPEDFKFLVDQLHQNGIYVIVDWIPTHYSYDTLEACLYNFDGNDIFGDEPNDWKTHYFNFARPETQRMLQSSALFWIKEMHIDGLRIDAAGYLVKRNGIEKPEALKFIKKLNDCISKKFPTVDLTAEDPDRFPKITDSVADGGLGFYSNWNTWWSIATRNLLKTPFNERSKTEHFQDKIVNFITQTDQRKQMIFSHSHDDSANRDEEHFPRSEDADNTLYKIECSEDKNLKFADLRNFFGFQFCATDNGVLFHMGDEFGEKRSWNTRIYNNEPDGATQWRQLLDAEAENYFNLHAGLQNCVSALGKLYRDQPAFWDKNRQPIKLLAAHQDNCIVAYQRSVQGKNSGVFVVHNFTNGDWGTYDIPLSGADNIANLQSLKKIFYSNAKEFGGDGKYKDGSVEIVRDANGTPTHLRTAIPPLSTLVFG